MSPASRTLGSLALAAATILTPLAAVLLVAPPPLAVAGEDEKGDDEKGGGEDGLPPGFPPGLLGDAEYLKAIKLYDKRDYKGARAALEKVVAKKPDHDEANLHLALIHFYYAEDAEAGERIQKVHGSGSYYGEALKVLLEGPFRGKYGEAAFATEGKTEQGHYYLSTDVAADAALLDSLREKLKKASADPEKNKKQIERLRQARTEGWKQVGDLLERMYVEYSGMFKAEKDEKLVSRVYVFAKREDFLAFAKSIGSSGESAAGFYSPKLRILVCDASVGAEKRGVLFDEGMDTILHEGFHQFLDYYLDSVPYWFNEGIAEYFGPSEIVPGQKKLRVGVVVKTRGARIMTRYQVIQQCLKPNSQEPVTPLKEFVRLDARAFMTKADVHYAQGWAWIHYLANGHPKGRAMLVSYFKALRDGKNEAGAFEAAFGGVDWSKVEADWRAYIQRL